MALVVCKADQKHNWTPAHLIQRPVVVQPFHSLAAHFADFLKFNDEIPGEIPLNLSVPYYKIYPFLLLDSHIG